jgi:hypothetical protein
LEWLEKSLPRVGELTKENAYRITDSSVLQKLISVANMWHDANHEEDFQKDNIFIPEYNGRNGMFLFCQCNNHYTICYVALCQVGLLKLIISRFPIHSSNCHLKKKVICDL